MMGSVTQAPPIVLYDYQYAPNAQRARNLLNAAGVPYEYVEQPFFQPRPNLTDLGIEYRRVPVNAIGKDVYCDNKAFSAAIQTLFKDKALATSPADAAYEAFGYRTFWMMLPLVPMKLWSKQLADDRKDLFNVFDRPDYAELRPNALGELKHILDIVENEFLVDGKGPFIGGADKAGMADINSMWMIKWGLQTIDCAEEPGLSKKDFPKVYRWVEALPEHVPDNDVTKLSADEAAKKILGSEYSAKEIGVDANDSTGLKAGAKVSVETVDDSQPSNKYQHGKLVGLNNREIVIELDNGLRLHFPRIGYAVKAA